jgi:hypothetical protein
VVVTLINLGPFAHSITLLPSDVTVVNRDRFMHYILCGLLAARPTNMTKGQNGGTIETGCPGNVHISSSTAGGGNIGHFPSCVMTSQ